MRRIKIRHTSPVWEETLVEAVLGDEHAQNLLGDDRDMELVDVLLNRAVFDGTATVQVTVGIDSMDADYEITDLGEVVHGESPPSPYAPEDLIAGTVFLLSLKGKSHEEVRKALDEHLKDSGFTTPRSYSKLHVLVVIVRQLRGDPGMDTIFFALKESFLEDE